MRMLPHPISVNRVLTSTYLVISVVKIPVDAIIPEPKLTQYLLVPRSRDDKSKFLAQGGFTQENSAELERAIRQLIAENDAVEDRTDRFGTFYEVKGVLRGVNSHLAPEYRY